ncbi:MAG: 2-hydroxy-3-oxopropionate reductase [Planctomycetota bacterium]
MKKIEKENFIGLVGLGLLGNAFAGRILQADFKLMAFDSDPIKMEKMAHPNFVQANSARDVFENCDKVFFCLPDSRIVNHVVNENLDILEKDLIILDATTGNPCDTTALAVKLSTKGVSYLDTTVSGSSAQVLNGNGMIMVGGCSEAFERCRDLIGCLVGKVFHTGVSGSASKLKLVSNLVLGLNRAALAEGLLLARAFGLDLNQTLNLLRESTAYSLIMDTKGEKMVHGDFEPQARLSQHMKDVSLMLEAADDMKIKLPFSETHFDLLERGVRLGMGDLDNSAIIKVIASLNEDNLNQ